MAICLQGLACAKADAVIHSFDFVAEHLPEALMDNRFATLPVWDAHAPGAGPSWPRVSLGYSNTAAGALKLAGPLAGLTMTHDINDMWEWTGLLFADRAKFSSGTERRPLEPLFSANIPLALPADALFGNLGGTASELGAGLVFARTSLGRNHRLIAGLLWQRLELRDYRVDFRLVSGASTGTAGTIDYSATYSFITPMVGIEFPRTVGNWGVSPHVLAAIPLPHHGMRGRILGPGFDIRGDTIDVGNGRHFGGPFLGIGLVLTYQPLKLGVDLGSSLSGAFTEKLLHKGISRNLLMSIEYQF